MLINKNNNTETHVKFIEYTGRWPNLCSGKLTLEIDGERHTFGGDYFEPSNFDRFWSSGGSVRHDRNYNYSTSTGEWYIDVNNIPEQFQKYAAEIDEVFNENVRWGCCGGCI